MSSAETDRAIDTVVKHLANSSSLLFITGAGVSADSGLPTYRGIGGLYNVEHPEEGIAIEDILSGDMIRHRPELTWKYVGQVEKSARGATFNRGHEVIAAMEARFPRVWTLTQNIDGFHRAAGSKNVLEIHGRLDELSCMKCEYQRTVKGYDELSIPPHCPQCGAMLRPDVVLFGEQLPVDVVEKFYAELDVGFDTVFSVGTTSSFPYIAGPVEMAHRRGWFSVEINPAPTRVSRLVDVKISLGAAAALDAIWNRLNHAAR
ncbi:MAG: SIR2 family NAD-dependent protein deacylase [Thermoguttaceae bacterium]